jgi:hypothetical protein
MSEKLNGTLFLVESLLIFYQNLPMDNLFFPENSLSNVICDIMQTTYPTMASENYSTCVLPGNSFEGVPAETTLPN